MSDLMETLETEDSRKSTKWIFWFDLNDTRLFSNTIVNAWGTLARVANGDKFELRDVDLQAYMNEIDSGTLASQAVWLQRSNLEPTDVPGISGNTPIRQLNPLVHLIWSHKATSGTEGREFESHFRAAKTWARGDGPKIAGHRSGSEASQGFTIFSRTTQSSRNLGMWIVGWGEFTWIQITKKDRRAEFVHNEHWEESHDHGYAVADNY